MEMTGWLLPIRTTNDWFRATASSSKPYSGLMAVREEDASDGAGEESCASKDEVGDCGAGTGRGDGDR